LNSSLTASLSFILIFAVILFAAYAAARLAGARMRRLSRSRCMEILDQVQVTKDKTILLLKVGERVFVVGSTAQGMNSIGELTFSELGSIPEETAGAPDFLEVWRDSLQNLGISGLRRNPDGKSWTDER
jgi:flagellar protein FliO/FliZ